MRTTKIIRGESDKALEAIKLHIYTCSICQRPIDYSEDEMTCYQSEFLEQVYSDLMSELETAEQVYQAEYLERNGVRSND